MKRTKVLVRAALGAAVMAVCAWLSIPGPIPFTMQSFAVLATAGVLGAQTGTLSVAVYLLLGAMGVPVFAGFSGGIGVLLGPTGGFLAGFVLTALLVGAMAQRGRSLPLAMGLGMAVVYAFGTGWYALMYGGGITAVLMHCVVPFLVPDCFKAALAVLVVRRIRGRAGLS